MTSHEVGDIIRRTRREERLRQDQLAAVAYVGVRFLVELERVKPTAQIGKVLAVLAALGCRVRVTPPGIESAQSRNSGLQRPVPWTFGPCN